MAKHTKDNGKHEHNDPGFGDWVSFIPLFALSGIADLAGWLNHIAG